MSGHVGTRGKKSKQLEVEIQKRVAKRMPPGDIARELGISRHSVYYYRQYVGPLTLKRKPKQRPPVEKICGNDLTPRDNPEGWLKYMKKNQRYYQTEISRNGKGMSDVCKEAFGLRKRMVRGEEGYFMDGLPQEMTEPDYSIGYGDSREVEHE